MKGRKGSREGAEIDGIGRGRRGTGIGFGGVWDEEREGGKDGLIKPLNGDSKLSSLLQMD